MNEVKIIKKNGITEIYINGTRMNFVGKYSITQDINIKEGLPFLEIKMAIDEEKSTITI